MSTVSSQIVRVDLGPRGYDIEIGSPVLPRAGQFLTEHRKATHAVVITDENVNQPHAQAVANWLGGDGRKVDLVVIPAGEASKCVELAAALWKKLVELGADRKSVIVAVGGGVVGDLAGFVAATYARGIPFLQVPTSLLAQVDSSVGGKVGIDLPTAKNMVGAFLQPMGVLIDTSTLATLPQREYYSGFAEVVKYGVILDAPFFEYLEANVDPLLARDPSVLTQVVARCCRIKADVVEKDEREETGLRAVLNYGHTFAHAMETLTGYDALLHGEAVSIGMMCAARLAERLGRVDGEFIARQRRLLEALGLPVKVPKVDKRKVLSTMMHDKKVEHGKLRLIVPARLGHVDLLSDVPDDEVRAAWKD